MDRRSVQLPAKLTYKTAAKFYKSCHSTLGKSDEKWQICLDGSQLQQLDSSGVTTLNILKKELEDRKHIVLYENFSSKNLEIIQLFSGGALEPEIQKEPPFFERLGGEVYRQFQWLFEMLTLTSNVFYWSFRSLIQPKLRRRGEVANQSVLMGLNALPIIALIAFLIGFILALQSAAQLRQFGANIFVADLVAIAMISEMGPLITAIMVAGRSGSAIAAEIATMQVSEEIDALKVMGIDPIPYLITPKVFAILISLPALTIFANTIGILGGMVIGVTYLDLDIIPFFNEVAQVVRFKEIFIGLFKSVVFAFIIVQTGAFFGFRVKGGAEGVGKATTISVVFSIFMVIVADSVIGLLFYFGGGSF
jgi:phospholipid/cholesterol/gamma-HCH transport system permease protein